MAKKWDIFAVPLDFNFCKNLGGPILQDSFLASSSGTSLSLLWPPPQATEAGKQAVRPGACAHDICHAMNRILSGGKGVNSAGRLGHGLGMQLTEWPSFMAGDASELKQGMVITLEPTLAMSDGTVLVHEDNFVITKDGLEQLSPQAPEHLWSV